MSSEATPVVVPSRRCSPESTCDDLATTLDASEAGEKSDMRRPHHCFHRSERQVLTLSEFITLIENVPINLWVQYSVAQGVRHGKAEVQKAWPQAREQWVRVSEEGVAGPNGQKIKYDSCEDRWKKDPRYQFRMSEEKRTTENMRRCDTNDGRLWQRPRTVQPACRDNTSGGPFSQCESLQGIRVQVKFE